MSAFGQGFKMGGDMYTQAQRNKTMALERRALERQEGRDIAQQGYDDQLMALYNGGGVPPGEGGAAPDMSGMEGIPPQGIPPQGGLQVPQAAGAEPQAMGVRPPGQSQPNFADPAFQDQMTTLMKQRALAGGNMQDFERLNAASLQQQHSREDSEFARAVVSDPTGDIARQARTWINDSSPHISVRVGKDGFSNFIVAKGDGYDEVSVSPADLGKIAVGMRRLERGDVGGLDVISAVSKDLAAAVREDMKLDLEVGKENNLTAYRRGQLGLQREELGIRRDTAARELATRTITLSDEQGNPVLMDPARIKFDEQGKAILPEGTRMPKGMTEADLKRLEWFYKSLQEDPPQADGEMDRRIALFGVAPLLGDMGKGGLPQGGRFGSGGEQPAQAQVPGAPAEAPVAQGLRRPPPMIDDRRGFAHEESGLFSRTPAQWGRDFADGLRSQSPVPSVRNYQREPQ
jgi:hypothetical protein